MYLWFLLSSSLKYIKLYKVIIVTVLLLTPCIFFILVDSPAINFVIELLLCNGNIKEGIRIKGAPDSNSTSFPAAVIAQSCLTLCNPLDCSLAGSSVYRILQARILEWVAISSFRGSSWPQDWTHGSCHASCITGGFFTTEAREALILQVYNIILFKYLCGV